MPTHRSIANEHRRGFEALLPDWKHDLNLGYGRVPNTYEALMASFYDWIEAKHPGEGANFLYCFKNPRLWRNLVKKHLVKYNSMSKFKNTRFFVYLNYEVAPKSEIARKIEYTACKTCGREMVDAPAPTWAPTDEEILKAWEALKARQKPST